ncbi:non-ribosomal peptide synthetase [Podospora aff. communis PSN243]|uniref:Non-ribosomal peptide synthetase n=1 Tax=Podospora aff. communis PSN243 TaxID=3040156 RepID=A0AAV9GH94_9PEZI|nr:non-ribosomal peptide synthetase [Podospora aff. communis PSN243]
MAPQDLDGNGNATPLSILNHPASRLPGPSLLHQLVRTSSNDGTAPAIVFLAADGTRSSLSYGDFHAAADVLASRISSLIGGSEPFVVPVLIPQSPSLYIAQLAILKAGGAFCPLNLDIPIERAKLILNEVKAKVVITTEQLALNLPRENSRVFLFVGAESESDSAASTNPPHRSPQPSDLAYVMYTSGSTGTPKGVGISHDAATQSLLGHDRHIPQFFRFLQFAAPTFDVSVFEIFFPFFRGRTLVSCDRSTMLNDLPAVLTTMNVDTCELTPSVAGSLLRTRESAPSLRLLLTIGEMLTGPVIREFGGSEEKDSILWGMYGPTEAAIHCTVQPAFGSNSLAGNIGVPFDTVSAFILSVPDKDKPHESGFRVLPRGEAGELAIGGHQNAEQYINRPEQTAAAFIDTPFGRLYRTGDKAVMHPDGTLECLGRIGFGQVKLRGQRIELGEIEHAALRTPGCHGAFAVIINNVLVLFCAVDEVGGMTEKIEDSCKRWLPGFMVPGDIVVAKEFPRLPSGKVDRKSLAANYSASESTGAVGYADDLERQLCEITSRLLRVEVRPGSNLSKFGVDSLVSIKLASALQEAGMEIGAVDILLSRTISILRDRVLEKRAETTEPLLRNEETAAAEAQDLELDDEEASRVEVVIPCTPLQVSMLAETMANPQAYCNWIELSFPAEFSDILVRSWILQIAATNEVLRTGFVRHRGRFLQVVFKDLAESQVQVVAAPSREFTLEQPGDLLRPFRVQIAHSIESDHRTVVFQIHHAVYDGWSMDLVLSDLQALAGGGALGARPQFRQVVDYYQSPEFQRQCDAARAFWADHLVGFQPPMLPHVQAEIPENPTVTSSSVPLDLRPAAVKDSLKGLGIGAQVVFQAALSWHWASFLGLDDVVVGTITSGRTLSIPRIQDIFGPCISPAPIRTRLSQVRTIRDLLSSVHSSGRATLPHSILPLGEIKRVAGVRSGQPLYDVLFVYQESLFSKGRATSTIKEISHQDFLETKLLVEVEPGSHGFTCFLTSRSDVFSNIQLEAMGRSIQALVQHMLKNMGADLVSMRGAFSSDLLSVFNPTPRSFSRVPDLASAVEQVAAEHPDKHAVCFADAIAKGTMNTTTVTFDWLNRMANRIAWLLKEWGVREGETVSIAMEKSVLLYAGILAILKSGAAYLPLLPSTPLARINTICRQADVRLCVSDTATLNQMSSGIGTATLDLQTAPLDDYPLSNPKRAPGPNRAAYVICTSGTTGAPKGVCVTQLNIVSNLDVLSRIYPVKPTSRLLQSCSQAFDVSVFEIFFAWTTGMCLCSGTNDTLFEDLECAIRMLGVTHLSMTPTVAGLVDPTKVPDVEFLVTAGEAMTEGVAATWGRKLFQGYGPSETTNICSVKRMADGPGQVIRHLGWAFENTSTVVLYPDSEEVVPIGALGELCFGGDQVAQGYINLPELTQKKFIQHPAYGRLYRSGDLGRMLPDGSMVIDGRVDHQVKVRGQRVELDEITATVRQAPGIVDCATILLKKDSTKPERIVTFFVPQVSGETGFRVLEAAGDLGGLIQQTYSLLRTRLPGYMVPSFLVPISVLPTTPPGKLDRRRMIAALNNLGPEALSLLTPTARAEEGDGEWSDVEREIAGIIATTFSVDTHDIRRWTPLATFGLDSITAIEIAKQLHGATGKRLAISEILANATVVRLAHALGSSHESPSLKGEPLVSEAAIKAVSSMFSGKGTTISDILPCTPLQEAMLAASGDGGRYLNRMLLRINCNLLKLREAWMAMCRRHGILRTCFVSTFDLKRPIVQVVLDQWEPSWHEINATGSSIETCVSSHVATVPLAIDSFEPTVSFATITHEGAVYLLFVCHHALYDGVAVERLLFEVEQVLSGKELGPAPGYKEFLEESLRLPTSTDEFWTKQLQDFRPQLLAGFDVRDTEPEPFVLSRAIGAPLSKLTASANSVGASFLALSQTSWAVALGCFLRIPDVCFGSVVSGRSLSPDGIDHLVAPCFNTIPIRMQLSAELRSIDLIKKFQALNPELLKHQFTPLRHIQSMILKGKGGKLFDTLLLLQQPARRLDEAIWNLERDDGEMDIPLVCELLPDTHDNLLRVKLHVEGHRFNTRMAELVLDLFFYVMENILHFPASAFPTIDTVPSELRAAILGIPFKKAESSKELEVQDAPAAAESWTATEEAIRNVISSLSSAKLEKIRRQTTIYQLGLDSISAVQVASILRKQGFGVSASNVIENPTCQKLGDFLDAKTWSGNQPNGHSGVTGVQRVPDLDLDGFRTTVLPHVEQYGVHVAFVEAVLPCTPLQSGMMAQFMKSGGSDYFNFLEFRVDGRIPAEMLVEAWTKLREVYPILRTGIVSVEHDTFSFAMIQCSSRQLPCFVDSVPHTDADKFKSEKWQQDASREALKTPHQSLWHVAIIERQGGCEMHLAIHHALYDAHSLQLILGALGRAVNGDVIPQAVATEEAVVDILGQMFTNKHACEAFWREQAGRVVTNGFPVMTPLRETTRKILVQATSSTMSFKTLETSASQSGYTLQAVLQAAWARLLSAYLGESSVVFGVVLSGRTTDTSQSAIFPCVTTLPVIATEVSSNRGLLDSMMSYNAHLYKQQHQPLTRIQQWLGRTDTKLFDTLLVYQKLNIDTSGPQPWRLVVDKATVDYPVSIEIEPTDDALRYQITHFSDVLPAEQARILLQQLDGIVQHLATQPDGDGADLVGLSQEIFSVLPAAQPVLPTPIQTLHQFVESHALLTPRKLALSFVDSFEGDRPVAREWTYEELNANGNQVANALSPRVKVGDIVAIDFDKCPEAYFSILGILKAGAAFVALDPGAPSARKQFILEDSGASVLLTSRAELDYIVSVPVMNVDEALLRNHSPEAPTTDREIKPSDVCYCLYTSGTTGTPKGCEITHDNAVQCMLAFQEIFRGHWEESSRWLQFASLHFDVSVLEQYWSWSVGITLVAALRDIILEDLAGTISKLGITHIDLTPSLARLLRPEDVPSLCRGVFITGGESLKQEILDAWGQEAVIYNFYGPTEATIGVTVFPRVPENGRSSNIGQQFINVGSYVLKPGTDIPVLRGAVGELCVSGRLVGKGYLNREELTAERFPTLQKFCERVYRTGDLVRVLHDGCFDFLGRADDQVKLRGQRLEIGEINHAIKTGVEEVKDVATLVVRNEQKQKDFLVSFVVTEDGKTNRKKKLEIAHAREASELARRVQHACRSRLPGYMVPTYVFQLPFIPLSPNNKAEVRELRALFNNLSQDELVSSSSTAEGSPTQLSETGKRIASVLSAFSSMKIDNIAPFSSIFELGVDSISVLRLSGELKLAGLAEANPALILRYPVIEDLAHALEAPRDLSRKGAVAAARQMVQACGHRHRPQVCRELGVYSDQIEYIAPCSPLQQGMISRSVADGAYFNTFRFKLHEGVSASCLREAWQLVVEATPILRTVFVATADGCVQVALKELETPWDEVAIPSPDVEEFLKRRYGSWVAHNQESVVRPWEIVLVEGDAGRLLVLHIFHALYDANSFQLMVDAIGREYSKLGVSTNGALTNGSSAVEKAPTFLEALCHGPLHSFAHTKDFWAEHLQGAAPIQMKVPRKPETSARECSISFEPLERLRSSLAVTQQAIVQAAWVWALAKQHRAGPTIGMIVSGRTIELDGAEKVIGPLFNTLPFHAKAITQDVRLSWAELVKRCHVFNTTVLEFQHIPLRDIQKWCSGGKPLFDTLFSFQRDDELAGGTELWVDMGSDVNADYPMALEATLSKGETLKLLVVGQGGEQELVALMDDLEVALAAMTKDCRAAIWLEGLETGEPVGLNEVMSQPLANGNGAWTPLNNGYHLDWTEPAATIRHEIASLAETPFDSISEMTSIFELGLDSIDVIKLSARLNARGVKIKTSQIMAAQTISNIVRQLQTGTSNGHMTNGHPSTRDSPAHGTLQEHLESLGHDLSGAEAVFPTTPLQDSMVAEMIHSNFQLYFNHDVLEIEPGVDVERLKLAWDTVVMASPTLRTAFVFLDDSQLGHAYCQVVSKNPHHHLAEVELESVDGLKKIADVAVHRARKAGGQSSLLQLVFARVNQRRFLVLSIAHALYDGWSLELLHQDVRAAYEGRFRPRPHYDAYLDEILHSSSVQSSDFWAGFLEGVSPTLISEKITDRQDTVFRIEQSSSASTTDVKSFCKAQSITLQALGQACWAAVLANRTGSLDVTFGVVLSGRDSETAEDFMFPTMNTVAVRSVLHSKIRSWLQYVQENATNVSAFQHFPLRKIQKLVKGVTGPLFNTLFIQQRRVGSEDQEEPFMRSIEGTSAVEFPVCVEMEMQEDGLVWRTACDGNYQSDAETSLLLRDLDAVLRYILRHPESDVLSFSETGTSVCGLLPYRKANVGVDEAPTNDSDHYGSPSPLEEDIRSVLSEVSGVPTASILPTHNIYHLGLDSISAIKAVSLLRKQGLSITFRDMLRAKSISEMACVSGANATNGQEHRQSDASDGSMDYEKAISDVLEDVDAASVLERQAMGSADIEEVLPATATQVHMLSVWQNTRGTVFYPTFNFRVTGVDASAVLQAWDALVAETPILRTTFIPTQSTTAPFLQVIHKTPPKVPYTSISVQKHCGNVNILLRIHHALYDAVSLSAMLLRFEDFCRGISSASRHHKAAWKASVAAAFEQHSRTTMKEFWTEYLSGVEPTPSSSSAPSGTSARTSALVPLAIKDISPLKSLCSARGITIQSLFFAAYASFLAKSSPGQHTVVFGIYLANRGGSDSSTYPTLRLVPLRVRLQPDENLVTVAERIQQDILAISARPNVDVGLWEIAEWTGIKVDSFVNFLSIPGAVEKSDGVLNGSGNVILEELPAEAPGIDEEHRGTEEIKWIKGNMVKDAYRDAIDVEVSIQWDGMTIGVFGSRGRLGEEGAKGVVDGIVSVLEGLIVP